MGLSRRLRLITLPGFARVDSGGGCRYASAAGRLAGLGGTDECVVPTQVETGQAPSLQATSEAETVIENDVYRIAFTNRGGRVKSWVLRNIRTIRERSWNW